MLIDDLLHSRSIFITKCKSHIYIQRRADVACLIISDDCPWIFPFVRSLTCSKPFSSLLWTKYGIIYILFRNGLIHHIHPTDIRLVAVTHTKLSHILFEHLYQFFTCTFILFHPFRTLRTDRTMYTKQLPFFFSMQ